MICLLAFACFCLLLLVFAYFCLLLLAFACVCLLLLAFACCCLLLLAVARFCSLLLSFACFCLLLRAFACFCLLLLACACFCSKAWSSKVPGGGSLRPAEITSRKPYDSAPQPHTSARQFACKNQGGDRFTRHNRWFSESYDLKYCPTLRIQESYDFKIMRFQNRTV